MDNLNDIIASLSADDINMLKGVASSILGGEEEKAPPPPEPNSLSLPQGGNLGLSSLGLGADDFNMMMKAKTIFDKMNSTTNKNTDLILALKPHLSPQNRDKADTAIKILRLFDMLPMLRELF